MSSIKPSYQFKYPSLSPSVAPNFQPYIKISIYFNKLPTITYEEFYEHWAVHADLMVAAQEFKHLIVRYVQIRQTPEMREQAQSLGFEVLPYDACADMYVKSFDDWLKFASSETFTTVLREDAAQFVSRPLKMVIGQEDLVYGKSITTVEGKDGLQPSQV